LAKAAREIEQVISNAFKNKTANSYLQKLLASFQKELLPTLQPTSDNEKDYSFADIYAQTIAYALFTARVFSYVTDKRENTLTHFDRESAWQRLPETNPFLRKLFEDISQQSAEDLGDDLIAAINDIFGILRAAKMDAILSDFQLKMNREDIVIRFYEDFLAAYKSDMRECRGVYFTPESVVSYIVRSLDYLLKKDFGLSDGIADASKVKIDNPDNQNSQGTHKVLITDIATGTGTFLYSIIGHIFNSLKLNPEQWSEYVSQNLLPRLLGFELLMAPYAVAHLKLGLQLAELGYKFDSNERLRVYLTNTLQEAFQIPPTDDFENWIRDEADAANRIKQEAPVMVVVGNPPYSGHSANKGNWISSLLKGVDTITNQKTSNYFEVDGKPLGERNPKWLNDDYVKFIRFGQWRIEQTGYGILAFITNHGYLDNPTFRGMRQSLMETFDDIYVLDLHGNSKKKEQSPDGSKDENVFDIQQGVAISIFVKRRNGEKQPANVYHADLYGLRESKYKCLKENNITTTQWEKLKPQSPFYLFVSQNTDCLGEYQQGWKVTDIFSVNSVGIVTGQDGKTIAFTEKQSQILANSHKLSKNTVIPILYRPFDKRFIVYDSQVVTRPRSEVMRHMLIEENLALIFMRQVAMQEDYSHFMATNNIVDNRAFYSNKGIMQQAPLYLYPNPKNPKELEEEKRPNFSPEFLKDITTKLGYTPTPEAIFYYTTQYSTLPPTEIATQNSSKSTSPVYPSPATRNSSPNYQNTVKN
jgi:predicted helicase